MCNGNVLGKLTRQHIRCKFHHLFTGCLVCRLRWLCLRTLHTSLTFPSVRQLNINFTPKTMHSSQVHSLLTLKSSERGSGPFYSVQPFVLCNFHYYYLNCRDALCDVQQFLRAVFPTLSRSLALAAPIILFKRKAESHLGSEARSSAPHLFISK